MMHSRRTFLQTLGAAIVLSSLARATAFSMDGAKAARRQARLAKRRAEMYYVQSIDEAGYVAVRPIDGKINSRTGQFPSLKIGDAFQIRRCCMKHTTS